LGANNNGNQLYLKENGNVGISQTVPTERLDVVGNINCSGNIQPSYITRSAHNTGFLVGSYNNIAGNETKTNPIYTIGSNYIPYEATLDNMYGIGYTAGGASFASSVLSGWGMYVASAGVARIGLDGQYGNIKCTGAVYVGGGTAIGSHSIYYSGAGGQGAAHGIAFKWGSPYIWGRVDNTLSTVVGNASDRRLKKNIKSIPSETSRKFLDVIKPRSYTSAECDISGVKISCDCDELMYGGVAQEVEEDFPELVHSPEDDGIRSLYTEAIVFMTISSLQLVDKNVKDLQTTIEKLEARLAALENK
jgi:hypothetical protein